MSDEDLFLAVDKELNSGNKNQALWVKALTLVGGDEKKAKYQYIMLRVEQIKNEDRSKPITLKVHYKIYVFSIIIGIAILLDTYLLEFDNLSETTLVRMTPLWFFPIIFGYYGFMSHWILAKPGKSLFENLGDFFLLSLQRYRALGLIYFIIHAPLVFTKKQKPILAALGGSLIWALLLATFFEVIFPML